MELYHNTRDPLCRAPLGAVETGTPVRLTLEARCASGVRCALRLWVDGETLLPMEKTETEGIVRFSCTLTPETAVVHWYSFLLTAQDGSTLRYGAAEGRVGGEGRMYDHEPPSFQLTAYHARPLPDWYKTAVVYQIFPDRFCRDRHWRARAEAALTAHPNGPRRELWEDWNAPPRYEKDAAGRMARWDFYGGSLGGIAEKLPYLRDMGVTTLYLNPIFEAASCHRYDTGDYTRLDPMLGTEGDFQALCHATEGFGISVILDGVFNHTGCDSRYFNKYGNYDTVGAWQGEASPYRSWFCFDDSPVGYASWWGVGDLPAVRKEDADYRRFLCGDDGIVRRWLRAGAKGWRLDVADELPDDLIEEIKAAALAERPADALLLGEVWEDASHKTSYGRLRRYLLGDGLDSVMNYPLRTALLDYLLGRRSADDLRETLEALRENYPPAAFYGALNLLGSHDRPRVLTVLGGAEPACGQGAALRLTEEQRGLAKHRLWLALLVQMTLPGVPCVYYGDEAGMEGGFDPDNRGGYPWDGEDGDVLTMTRSAVALRRALPVCASGDVHPFAAGEDVFGFFRVSDTEQLAVAVNRSNTPKTVTLPVWDGAVELIAGQTLTEQGGQTTLTLSPFGSAAVWSGKPLKTVPMPRGSGVLCHVTSLPSGTLESAELFLDVLARAKQTYWQILPLNPTDAYGSPYAGLSAFAGNPALLGVDGAEREPEANGDYDAFCAANADWLDYTAMFFALTEQFPSTDWQNWPEPYRAYAPTLYDDAALAARAETHKRRQYRFEQRWQAVRRHARQRGISIIGDLPMYVAPQSADVWASPELFLLDKTGHPALEAGVPPDCFTADGQLWGNPLYNWDAMSARGYDWWLRRLERAFRLYDFVRLDHFRGFASCWAVPVGEKAAAGRWRYGPGIELFQAAEKRFGALPVIAEDLGQITPAVRALLARCGFPGIAVLQFADGDPLEAYAPPKGKLACTGTHDNETLRGWCEKRYPERDAGETARRLLENLYASDADVVITPLQDALGLGNETRMNTPGTVTYNWRWQAERKDLPAAEALLRTLTEHTNRG